MNKDPSQITLASGAVNKVNMSHPMKNTTLPVIGHLQAWLARQVAQLMNPLISNTNKPERGGSGQPKLNL